MQTKAGIIGGMVSPVIALVWFYVATYGEHTGTGEGLLLGFLLLAFIAGAIIGAITGTIIGTIAKVLTGPLLKEAGSYEDKPTNNSPELWHNVTVYDPNAAPNLTSTSINRRSAIIGGFIGGLLPSAILLLWSLDII